MRPLLIIGAIATAFACAPTMQSSTGTTAASTNAMGGSASAVAVMRDSAGNDLGTLIVSESGSGLTTAGTLHGLPPGTHGTHFHTIGQCVPPFTSAGAHWNPTNRRHGTENPQGPHLGDMPNISVGVDSTSSVRVSTLGGTLHGTNPLLDADGAAVVIHAGTDDLRTDPAGNSGARIACGVVRAQ
jgi:Cu-Zn family superoxide dismutase